VPTLEPDLKTVPVKPTSMYIQAGAFAQFDNANRVKARLQTLGPNAQVTQTNLSDRPLFRVRIGPLQNLDDEATYIAQDDASAARVVVERVLAAVAMLADQPALGRPGRVPETRELIVAKTRYLVPYRVRGGTVEVLRVFHTSRRLPNKW
jgi:plasmid stabilization system protein ParE